MEFCNKTVILTGASSGIGKEIAQLLANAGNTVLGLSRRANNGQTQSLGQGQIVQIKCDITDDASVKQAFSYITENYPCIDALINCAGNGIAGAVEETSIEEAKAQLETNFFGTLRMINETVPLMRLQGFGHIINIGSVAGLFGIPFQGMYTASKYAIEGLTEALRNEVRPFGIKVCCIEPGDTQTGFTAQRVYTKATAQTAYKKQFSAALHSMVVSEIKGKSPNTVAKATLKMLKLKNPPVRYVVGFDYKLLAFLKRLMPDRFINFVLYKMYCGNKTTQSELWSFEKDVLKQDKN